jgi:hypothetical protein
MFVLQGFPGSVIGLPYELLPALEMCLEPGPHQRRRRRRSRSSRKIATKVNL